jgi:hypothetical protein
MHATLQRSGMSDLAADELALVDVIVPRLSRPDSGLEWSSEPAFQTAGVDPDGGIAYYTAPDAGTLYAVPVPGRGKGKADATTRAVRTNNEVTFPPDHVEAALGLDHGTVAEAREVDELSDVRLAVFARPDVIAFRRAETVTATVDVQADLEALAERSLFE